MSKIIIYVVTFVIVVAILLLSIQISSYTTKINSIVNLPIFQTVTLDSMIFSSKELYKYDKFLLIVYFHPECEFCELEINDLLKNIEEMNEIQMLFISFASVEEINKYAKRNILKEFEDVIIVSDYYGEFAYAFNIKSSPTNFIYDKNKKLIKVYKGVMPFKQLKKYLKYSY